MSIFDNINTEITNIGGLKNISLSIKREDLNHPEIMGNKLRKLKYNIIKAQDINAPALLSFGGAFSNHILAFSVAGRIFNIPTIGIIRGEELANKNLNPILEQAQNNGMKLHFVTREEYKNKNTPQFLEDLKIKLGNIYIVPEGGSNDLAIKGAAEIIDDLKESYDYIALACGTGGTMAGIIKGLHDTGMKNTKVIGFPALKNGEFIADEIRSFLPEKIYSKIDWQINTGYHFGGYAKTKPELIEFIRTFKTDHKIDLDFIYTGKMMYGIFDLIKNNYFKQNTKILTIHTGGTQTALVK